MKIGLMTMMMAGLLVSGLAGAAENIPQQEKMTMCSQQAKSQALKGEARKTFMSKCLKKDSKLSQRSPQQMKMTQCNSEAGDKKLAGDARKTFMRQCLKKS